jgi:hypothetical protein
MLNLNLTVAWSWWQWSLLGTGALFSLWLLVLFVINLRPRRQPRRNWKRYNTDSRYL